MRQLTSSAAINERVFKWWDYPLFFLLSGLSLAAILFFLVHWFSFNDWLAYPFSFSVMTLMLVGILINNQGRWFLLLYMKRPKPMAPRIGWKVAVVTTFVPTGESLEMLEETIRALKRLDYPHDTWILDEGDDERVKSLCLKLGAHSFNRKNLPKYQAVDSKFLPGTKHGNYNVWLYEIGFDSYEIISAFDPDQIPQPTFLSSVIGYFDDPKVAYVQVAQSYYNQKAGFVARGAAEETYEYYSSVQMASYGMGYPIIVGSHSTQRVAALRNVGGFAAHDADDLLLTLCYRSSGWKGVHIPKILAKGITPVDWPGYLRQQHRWARSVLDIKFRRYFEFSRTLSVKSKLMSFLHGFNFLHRSILIVVGFVLTSFMLATGKTPSVVSYVTMQDLGMLWLVLQACELYRQRFYLDPNERGFHWRVALLQYAKWPWFLLAFVEVLLGKERPYVLTTKVKANSKDHLLLLPNLLVIFVLGTSWVIGQSLGATVHPLVYVVAAAFMILSLILIWTEFWEFPAPYDEKLIGKAVMKIGEAPIEGRSNFSPRNEHTSRRYGLPEHVAFDSGAISDPLVSPPNGDARGASDPLSRQVFIRNQERGGH